MKLIIERDKDGEFYIYRESEKHHAITEPQRANEMQRCDTSITDYECYNGNMPENTYLVYELDNRKHRKVKNG